jgi:uncharacterized membrane protein
MPPDARTLLLGFDYHGLKFNANREARRFHAWQSSLIFTAVFIVHLIFSWSTFLSWVIFLGDLGLMAFMALKAYRDADTLDR